MQRLLPLRVALFHSAARKSTLAAIYLRIDSDTCSQPELCPDQVGFLARQAIRGNATVDEIRGHRMGRTPAVHAHHHLIRAGVAERPVMAGEMGLTLERGREQPESDTLRLEGPGNG